MSRFSIYLDPDLGITLTIVSFENVKNVVELRQKVLSGSLECCLIKRSLIIDPLQIAVAANKALLAEKFKHLTTRNIYSEILFNLNLSKNITQSLKRFGIDDSDKHLLVVIVKKDEMEVNNLLSQIDGDIVNVMSKDHINEDLIKRIYKVTEKEYEMSCLVDVIISKITTKDFVSH